MKKSNLIVGIADVVIGAVCMIAALLTETELESILWGFSGGAIFPGMMMICKYFYWNAPGNKERYEARLENERIELYDELKVKIRDRAGRYAYSMGLLVISLSVLVFGILGAFEIVENSEVMVFYLVGFLLFQIMAGNIIFKKLMKRY